MQPCDARPPLLNREVFRLCGNLNRTGRGKLIYFSFSVIYTVHLSGR